MKLSDHSFAVFVYPFAFERARFDDLAGAVDRDALGEWDPWVAGAYLAGALLMLVVRLWLREPRDPPRG